MNGRLRKVGMLTRVGALQGSEYTLVENDTDVESTLDTIGVEDEEGEYLYLLVKVGDGEYEEVWGMVSRDLTATAELLYLEV
jgi:hypothetical protein